MLKQFLEAKPVNGRRVRIKNEREYVWLFPVEQLHIGDVVRVFPGERIPMDGVISKGESNITSSVIAGESVIVGKKAGDGVQCGTINCSAVIDIKVTAEFLILAYSKGLIDCKNCVCRKAGGRDWLTALEVLMGKRPEVNFSVLIN